MNVYYIKIDDESIFDYLKLIIPKSNTYLFKKPNYIATLVILVPENSNSV